MPVTSTLASLGSRLQVKILGAIASPELAQHLGQTLSEDIVAEYFSSGMKSQTGNTVDTLSYVGEPERTATGISIGVVGPGNRIGDPSDAAPKGTIRAFLDWYNKQDGLPKFFIRGGVPSQYAWWMLSSVQKQVLQRERLAGRFGGESAAGAGRVPYAWLHEKGNTAASIQGRQFIEKGLARWRGRVSGIIDSWYRARSV
jgi:hypothetical protein